MASNSVCQPCARLDETSNATNWCLDCEEPICGICARAHKAIKSTTKHHIIDIKAASIVPTSIMSSLKECPRHSPSTIDFFCTQHDVLCCGRCLSEGHRSCDKIVPLEDACQNVKKSAMLHDTNKDLKHLLTTLQNVIKDRKQNKQNIETQKKTIQTSITQFKQFIVTQLDKMEKSSLMELEELCIDVVKKTKEENKKAETCARLIETYIQQTEFMTENGSNQHLFTFLNHLLPKIKREQDTIGDVITKSTRVTLLFEQNENLLQGNPKIGTVEIKEAPCEIPIIRKKDTAAQEISLVQSQPIKSFAHDYDFDGSFECVTAIDVDKDNHILLADQSNLKMYSLHGKCMKQCTLDGITWGLSCHKKSSRIVVALRGKEIQFIADFIPQPKIPVPSFNDCYGIPFINDNIAVGGKGKISILDFNGKHIRTITTETTRYIFYLHHHQGKFYFTDNTNKVYCIKEDGTKLPTITVSEIRAARAVTTNHRGNLYVAGYHTNNIVRLLQDGNNCKVILNIQDGITRPCALCFSRDYKTLFVSCRYGTMVRAFKCEY